MKRRSDSPVVRNVLVIRFSALGDVAMAVPVIKCALKQNPELNITVASNSFHNALFDGIERCSFYGARLKEDQKGLAGIFSIFREIKRLEHFDCIIDLHDVIRSKILRFLFQISGVRSFHIDKGRKEKKELTRKKNKIFKQLKTTHQRYADVFNHAGVSVKSDIAEGVFEKRDIPELIRGYLNFQKKWIGFAPFSSHPEKMYPLEKMKRVVSKLQKKNNIQILFFGSRDEAPVLEEWQSSFPGSFSVAGKYSFSDELRIISNLDGMVSMDSANVHLACLFGVQVITIWGPTHPFAGFAGWGQSSENFIQVEMECRPSSIYGNKPCYCHGKSCMDGITEDMIIEKVNSLV